MPSRPIIPLAAGLLVFAGLSAHADIPGDVSLESAFGGETFSTPVALRHAGDGRRFVVERGGSIRIVDAAGNKLATPFLDSFGESVSTSGEGGLLGLAFHPDYASNGLFYVNYTWHNGTGLITRIAEFEVSAGDPNQADPGSERVILEIPQDFTNHNAGDLHFGPDGYLWIAMGDGGGSNDSCNRAQTLDPDDLDTGCGSHPTTDAKALLGKMLRIDVDAVTPPGENRLCGAESDGSAAYAVPSDNPFAIADTILFADRFEVSVEACAEAWAYGFRNPYRFSFDRGTGDIWIGDVGQSTWEEIDLESAANSGGDNYGWKVCEGSFERGSTTNACPLAEHHGPLHEYANDATNCSVTGGFRYRGPVTSLQGRYVFGDFCSAKVWLAEETAPDDWEVLEFDDLDDSIFGFGEDEAGELYLLRGNDILIFDGNRL